MLGEGDIRRLALELPETEEADHHGMASFRVAGKIICTIHVDQPRMYSLTRLERPGAHRLDLQPESLGFSLYSFAF